jgi:hypothetical protein
MSILDQIHQLNTLGSDVAEKVEQELLLQRARYEKPDCSFQFGASSSSGGNNSNFFYQ